MDAINNREIAILLWLAVALSACLLKENIRTSLFAVVRAFMRIKIIIPILLLAAYIGTEVWIGRYLSIWNQDLIKDTLIWAITSGLVMFFNYDEVSKKTGYFRSRIVQAFQITVFIEVYVNLFVLSLAAELVLQPVFIFIALLSAVAALKPEYKNVKKLTDGLLVVMGIGLILLVTWRLIANWNTIDKLELMLQFALPVWLTLCLLPFVYIIALYANYESAFIRIKAFARNWKYKLRADFALIIGLNIQAHRVGDFGGIRLQKIANASSFKEALKIVMAYRKS